MRKPSDLQPKSRYIIVDRNDKIIGAKPRAEITLDDIYRVSSVWVVVPGDDGDSVLIAQRALTKQNDPGKWGPSIAGTVDEGEDYLTNAVKELGEEVGITGVELRPMNAGARFHDGEHKYFVKKYVVVGDWREEDFVKQDDEVEALKLWKIDELLQHIQQNPDDYLVGFLDRVSELKRYLEYNGDVKRRSRGSMLLPCDVSLSEKRWGEK